MIPKRNHLHVKQTRARTLFLAVIQNPLSCNYIINFSISNRGKETHVYIRTFVANSSVITLHL